MTGEDLAFVIRGGPNSEHLFLIKKRLLDTFLGSFFLKTKPVADSQISRMEEER